MQITLDSYINNPMGTSRAHMVGERQAAAATYSDKFDKLLMKSAGSIDYTLFRNAVDPAAAINMKPNNNIERYIILIKIPSESIPRVVYDVGIEFYTRDMASKKSTTLDTYYVKFFSNDPNFTYTYAYTFKKNKLIIEELMNKLDPRSLKEKPKVTNPNTLVGYVKSIYFAYLFINNRGLMNKFNWYGSGPINPSKMNSIVMSTQYKLAQVDRLTKLYNATKHGTLHIGDENDINNLNTKVNRVETTKAANKAYERVRVANVKRTMTARKVSKVKSVKRVKR